VDEGHPIDDRAERGDGFAELAGSGLSAVHTAWRKARRRPPKIESNSNANTFTLTLDWRSLEEHIDDFWKQKIGVKITPEQAAILSVLVTPKHFTLEQIASACGLYLNDTKAATDYLRIQALITEEKGKYSLRPDLAKLATGRKQSAG
jgi:predicted HTH transcriptional regulator